MAIDCEFVGIGERSEDHALARVSIVNYHGVVLLDTFVRPAHQVTDYRAEITGIGAHHLRSGISFREAQLKVHEIISNRVIVGHGLRNDFAVLLLSAPERNIRDTARYLPFRSAYNGKTPSLRLLAESMLQLHDFQSGSHCSVQDAQVAMLLYRKFRREWEDSLKSRGK